MLYNIIKLKKGGKNMKKFFRGVAIALGKFVSCFALLAAISSTGTICWFMTYQPDVPEELMSP